MIGVGVGPVSQALRRPDRAFVMPDADLAISGVNVFAGRTDYDYSAPTLGTTYYVANAFRTGGGPLGSDANPGTSAAAPLLTLAAAFAKAGEKTIIADGRWWNTDAIAANGRPVENVGIALRPADGGRLDIIEGIPPSGLSWSAAGGGRFTTSFSGGTISGVVDLTDLDDEGAPIRQSLRASSAEVDSLGGYWVTGSTLHLKLADARTPDDDVIVVADMTAMTGGALITFRAPRLHVKGLRMIGLPWNNSVLSDITGGSQEYCVFDGCTFGFTHVGSNYGFSGTVTYAARTLLRACRVHYPSQDGMNYDGVGKVIEERCRVVGAGSLGLTSAGNQSSTGHNGTRVVTIAPRYVKNGGAADIADVAGGKRLVIDGAFGATHTGGAHVQTTNSSTWVYRSALAAAGRTVSLNHSGTGALVHDGAAIGGTSGTIGTYTQGFAA